MTVSTPMDPKHPTMIAWEAYKATEDYANTRKWARDPHHVDGSLWAAFTRGIAAAHPPQGSGVDALLLQALWDDLDRAIVAHCHAVGSVVLKNKVAAIRTHLSAPAGAGEKEL